MGNGVDVMGPSKSCEKVGHRKNVDQVRDMLGLMAIAVINIPRNPRIGSKKQRLKLLKGSYGTVGGNSSKTHAQTSREARKEKMWKTLQQGILILRNWPD